MNGAGGLGALRRFSRPVADAIEWCAGCRAPLTASHEHRLVGGASGGDRRLECICISCAERVSADVGGGSARVPRQCVAVDDLAPPDVEWDGLGVPIRLAFFVLRGGDATAATPTAFFPSPAGAIELQVDGAAWGRMCAKSHVVRALRPEVEALLLHHARPTGDARQAERQYVVSLDVCYALVGVVRAHWRGFQGGADVWTRIEALFDGLEREARRA